mmetsp:Transcript_40225/g.89282  ORF Transcript_40225/g.89282 Transcript_40225/m.89282 type:complete len:430 (+) Transcript_40225:36-1325(+)
MDVEDEQQDLGPSEQEFQLAKENELRMECNGSGEVIVRLLEGTAEIFGAEIQRGQAVNVAGQKLAVFTWTGCKIKVQGRPSIIYTAGDTPVVSYQNVHTVLNRRREEAQRDNTPGPVCIVVGPTDSGKSTLCRMLCNWAVRSGWEPTFVDLDIGQGSITVPGCISATPVETPIDVEDGYPLEMPLVYFYGHASPSDNPELYKFLVDRLAHMLERRAQANPKASASGLIINTLGWIDGLGYELQLHAMSSFKADVVLVMELDRLYTQVSTELKGRNPPVSVVKLNKSGGVVKRERDERRTARDARIREYFYGSQATPLQPVSQALRADQLQVYRIGGGARAPNSALPIGAQSSQDPLKVVNLPASLDLAGSLLAVSHASKSDQILSTNVAGFVLVKDVDSTRGTVSFMSPCPGPLPGRYLVTGSLRSTLD